MKFFPIFSFFLAAASTVIAQRQTVTLDFDWRFQLGDFPAAAETTFDDTSWRKLDVPHDWAWEAPYDAKAAQGEMGGYKPGGIGWYRRTIDVPADWSGRAVTLEFDGVYMDSTVWLNGEKVGGCAYGYRSFAIDLTPHLKRGGNVLAVRVDNSREPSVRWYHGCGIYAPVRLVVTHPARIATDGVQIAIPSISNQSATVSVALTLAGIAPASPGLSYAVRILDPAGKAVAEAASSEPNLTLQVAQPRRWDLDTPHLYTAECEVRMAGTPVDTARTRFGFRTISWEVETGFWLNGRNVKLLGMADHLEAGPVGAASPEKLIRWKLELLKAMGVNAVRTAHNPQVPAFYDICDELGMLVMDEMFDGWSRKAPEDYGARFFDKHWKKDTRDWVRRNRNHPSIVIYSVGKETKGQVAAELVRVVREMDPSRPVTSGHSGSNFMDVYGINGHSEKQGFFTSPRPKKALVATEAPHTWTVRGFYRSKTWWRDGYPNKNQDPFPLPDLTDEEIFTYDWIKPADRKSSKQVFNSSYDNGTVRISARKSWELLRDLPWMAGQFRWTGFDYVGEAGYVHGGWPFRAFMGGALDLAGLPKDLFYFYQSQWTTKPMVHLLPHWTHPRMKPGTVIPVWAYSNADEVELFLNGRSLGRDRPGKLAEEMQCEWMVPWEPGTLEAVSYRGGIEVARTRQVTASAPTRLQVESDTTNLINDGHDVAIVTVAQLDANGTFYPYGENAIGFHLEGPAKLLSLENGNPIDTSPNYGTNIRRTFFGYVRAFVRSTRDVGDISMVIGAINGERRQLTSNLVTIDVQRLALRGATAPATFTVHYTTDGSAPTSASPRYTGAFAVSPGTTVRAAVWEHGTVVLDLEETFATDAGLHWLAEGESHGAVAAGRQAEDARLGGGARADTELAGHFGTGYAVIPVGGTVEWYEENDGSAGQFKMQLRWQGAASANIAVSVNGRDIPLPTLESAHGQDTWRTTDFSAPLQPGGNTMRVKLRSGGPLLVDELTITSTP